MTVRVFEQREIRLFRLFFKAWLLRIVREQNDQPVAQRIERLHTSIEKDCLFASRTLREHAALILLSECLEKILLLGPGVRTEEEWKKDLASMLDDFVHPFRNLKLDDGS